MNEDSQEEVEVQSPQQGTNVAKKNWKEGFKFGKVKPMPPSDYKKKIK